MFGQIKSLELFSPFVSQIRQELTVCVSSDCSLTIHYQNLTRDLDAGL